MSKDNKVSFIIDSNGNKTHAIIPIDAYQELLNLQTILKSSFDLNEKENYSFISATSAFDRLCEQQIEQNSMV